MPDRHLGHRGGAVTQVSQAHAKVMVQRVRDADGEAEAEQPLGQAERPQVTISAEESAGDDAPQQRGRG